MSVSTVASASRVGKQPIIVPTGVDIKVQDQHLTIKGPKGQSMVPVHPLVQVELSNGILTFQSDTVGKYCRSGSGTKLRQSITGTMRAKINNVVTGVTKGYERKLVLVGVGYKAASKGKTLNLILGYSHPVDFPIPEGIIIETPTQTEIIIKGIDKHLVGQTAAKIRDFRSPEPYKGKGIRYANEVIILKETKKK